MILSLPQWKHTASRFSPIHVQLIWCQRHLPIQEQQLVFVHRHQSHFVPIGWLYWQLRFPIHHETLFLRHIWSVHCQLEQWQWFNGNILTVTDILYLAYTIDSFFILPNRKCVWFGSSGCFLSALSLSLIINEYSLVLCKAFIFVNQAKNKNKIFKSHAGNFKCLYSGTIYIIGIVLYETCFIGYHVPCACAQHNYFLIWNNIGSIFTKRLANVLHHTSIESTGNYPRTFNSQTWRPILYPNV